MNVEYLFILLGFLIVAFVLRRIFHLQIYATFQQAVITTITFFLVGTIWDSFAIWRGHWFFSSQRTLGVKIGLMPIEEYLFTLIVPYAVLVTYKCIEKFVKKSA